jgi:hypothetical protein
VSVVSHVRRASTTSLTFTLKDRISACRDSGLPVSFWKTPFFPPLDLPARRDHASPHWDRFAIPEPSFRPRTGAAEFSAGQFECAWWRRRNKILSMVRVRDGTLSIMTKILTSSFSLVHLTGSFPGLAVLEKRPM